MTYDDWDSRYWDDNPYGEPNMEAAWNAALDEAIKIIEEFEDPIYIKECLKELKS